MHTEHCFILSRAGSVSVFGVGIGIRYFRRYFFHVGSVFCIGILKYLGIRYGIGISEIPVENRKFLLPHLYLASLLRVTPSEFHSRVPFWKIKMMGPPGDEKV